MKLSVDLLREALSDASDAQLSRIAQAYRESDLLWIGILMRDLCDEYLEAIEQCAEPTQAELDEEGRAVFDRSRL